MSAFRLLAALFPPAAFLAYSRSREQAVLDRVPMLLYALPAGVEAFLSALIAVGAMAFSSEERLSVFS